MTFEGAVHPKILSLTLNGDDACTESSPATIGFDIKNNIYINDILLQNYFKDPQVVLAQPQQLQQVVQVALVQ